jgi:hypothetical protein
MPTRPRSRPIPILLVIACLAGACAVPPPGPGARRPEAPVIRVQPVPGSRATRLGPGPRPGVIVVEGSSCGQTDGGGRIEMAGSETLPLTFTGATVLLNGWKLRYLSSDHHVRTLYAAIEDVTWSGQTLSWTARGELSDENDDDGYEFCYWYVVLGWNQSVTDASTDNTNIRSVGSTYFRVAPEDPIVRDSHPPAYAPAYFRNRVAAGKRTIAILPRGFGLDWGELECQTSPVPLCITLDLGDSHVLQLAYVLGQSARFLTAGLFNFEQDQAPIPAPSRIEDGLVSWRSSGILKDNGNTRAFVVRERTTALFGNDLDVVEPPYAPPVRDNRSTPSVVVGGPDVQTEDVTIEGVLFSTAIPMLAGWELRYPYGAQHVREVGVWVHEFAQSDPPGTLRYKLSWVLRDRDNKPATVMSHKVNILGIR